MVLSSVFSRAKSFDMAELDENIKSGMVELSRAIFGEVLEGGVIMIKYAPF